MGTEARANENDAALQAAFRRLRERRDATPVERVADELGLSPTEARELGL